MVMATGQLDDESFMDEFIQWTDADYQSQLQSGGLIGLYWFPGITSDSAVLPLSGFEIGGFQQTVPDPDFGNAGMIVPSNNGQSLTIAYFDSETTGSPDYLPPGRFTAISIPPSGYELWREANFSEAQIAAGDGDPLADPDGDGLANLMEYATGSPPLSPSANPLTISQADGEAILRFRQVADAELIYRVVASNDLSLGSWADVVFESTGALNIDGWVETGVPLNASRRFFRLVIDRF